MNFKLIKNADGDIKRVSADYELGDDEELVEVEEESEGEESEDIEEKVKSLFENSKEGIKEEVKDELAIDVKKFIKDEVEKKKKKLGVYNKDGEEDEVSQEEKNKKFIDTLKKVSKRGATVNSKFSKKATEKAMNTSEPSEIVDEEVSFEIMNAEDDYGVARELFRVETLSKNSYSARELATDVSVAWVSEAGTISSTDITVSSNSLDLNKLAAIAIMSNEILEDAEVDLRSFLTDRIGRAFSQEEDRVFLAGDSGDADTPVDGLLYDSAVEELQMDTGDTDTSAMNGDYLLDLQAQLPKSVRQNGEYLMDLTIFNVVRKLKDSNNNPIYKDLAGNGPDTIHGKPVTISDVMPADSDVSAAMSFVLFGDFGLGAVLGTKGGVRIDPAISGVVTDEDSTDQNLFETDQVAIRFIERVGYSYILTNTIAKLTTGAAS